MNKFLILLTTLLTLSSSVFAVQLELKNKDAVALNKKAFWNLKVVKNSATVFKLTSFKGSALSALNYGSVDVGGTVYDITKDISLTQGACNTLWSNASDKTVYLYAGYGNSYATSVSDTSPSTSISGGSDTNFKIAVDGNPVVSITLTLSGLNSGANIAAGLTTQINAALAAASQGARVDVAYGTVYTITSRLAGARSSVVVTDGTTLNIADDLKIGVANAGVETAGIKGTALCVSDTAAKTTVGSTAIGSTGYVSCSRALPSATVIRQIASNALNCTGPVIGATILDSQTYAPGTIANADVASDAAIDFSKLASLDSTYLLVGSSGNVPTKRAVTGDVTIGNTGVTTIGAGKVTEAMQAVTTTAGLHSKRIAHGIYNLAAGFGTGAHTIGATIPANSLITGAWYYVQTTFTSATDAATIALSVEGANDIFTATAISTGTTWDAVSGAIEGTPKIETTASWILTTQARALTATTATETITGGVLHVWVEYITLY